MTAPEVQALLRELVRMWPQFVVRDGSIQTWHRYLEPFPADAVALVVREYAEEGHQFGPPVSVLLGKLRELSEGPSPELEAGEAWDKALRFVREFPPHREAAMDAKYPLMARVVRMVGGWAAMRASSSEALLNNTRPHFLRLYASLVGQTRRLARLERSAPAPQLAASTRTGLAGPRIAPEAKRDV